MCNEPSSVLCLNSVYSWCRNYSVSLTIYSKISFKFCSIDLSNEETVICDLRQFEFFNENIF